MTTQRAPERRVSISTLRVRFAETDLMGIVHHSEYLRYFEVGRVDWLREAGVRFEDWGRRDVHLPVVDADLKYKRPARFDEAVSIETWVAERSRVTVRFAYRVLGETGTLLCEGSTRLACVGAAMTPKAFPPDVAEILDR